MSAFTLSQFLVFAAALVAVGAASGTIAGMLGVGGGIVVVPLLFQVLTMLGYDADIAMHVAVGTSLATIVFTAFSSTRAHRARGSVDELVLRAWGPWIAAGAVLGTVVAGVSRGSVLSGVFALIALGVAAYMIRSHDPVVGEGNAPGPLARVGLAGFVGGASSMMGIGGGTLMVPILSAYSYPMRRAVGTAAAAGLIVAVPGAIGFAIAGSGAPGLPPVSIGYVNALSLLLIIPLGIFMAPFGARIAHGISPTALRRVFAVFLLASAGRMIHAAVTG